MMDVQESKIPNTSEAMEGHEKGAFDALIRPSDSYTSEGTYWADLPFGQRMSYGFSQTNSVASEECAWLWNMFKNDPLEPIGYYFKNFVLPGAGLGLEGYVLFSVSNVETLFGQSAFGGCWGGSCNQTMVHAVSYIEVIGILLGQLLVGVLGDMIGRRYGLIQDAVIMTIGLIMLTASWGITYYGWVVCYAISLLVYSIGVGGEYPMTATIGMEKGWASGKISTAEDRLHRGRTVVGAFMMQGWGQFFNQAILMVALLAFNHGQGFPTTTSKGQTSTGQFGEATVQWTYRLSFAIPAVLTAWLIYFRAYHMKGASRQLDATKARASVTGYDMQSLHLTMQHFWPRVLATAGGWFMNDVFFYGNKLFSANFIAVVQPNAASQVMVYFLWNLANIVVELAGYYLAMWFVDHKLYGRKWMQIIGFFLCFIFFAIPGFRFFWFTDPTAPPSRIKAFQAMYFLTSFFNQFGPNCVTFLVAAEVYPTPIRGTAHGISAAAGKLGALMIGIIGNYISDQRKLFIIVSWFGLLGAALTLFFLPDTTGLDLREQERRWQHIREGREHEYHGTAVHPRHLSMWENWMGHSKHYNAELDYQMKVKEFRAEWETAMASRAEEKEAMFDMDEVDDAIMEGPIHDYFARTSPEFRGKDANDTQETMVLPPPATEQQPLSKE